jgi:tRNA-dihydrouridine synthase
MASLTHGAFRRLTEEIAPFDLYFSEMISAGPLISRGRFEEYYLDDFPSPDRLVYQLVSPRGDLLLSAAQRIALLEPAGIDVNFGCSAPEIVRNGGGIAWLRRPEEALAALGSIAKAIAPIPLSVKLRLPQDFEERRFIDFLAALEQARVSAVAIHPRYQKQSYGRPAHRTILRRLAEKSALPLVASGDVTDTHSLQEYRRMPGIAGAMIGRGAIANPWIAEDLRREAGDRAHPRAEDRLRVAQRYFGYLEDHQPPEFWVSRSRRFLSYYLPALPFGRRVAAQLQELRDYPGIKAGALAFLERRVEVAV